MDIRKKLSEDFPFKAGKFPVFYGWIIIPLSILGVILSTPGQTMGVSVFTDHLLENLALTRNQLSASYMVATVLSSLLLTKAGKFYDTYGVRIVAFFATVGLGLTLFYLSNINHFTQFIIGIFHSNTLVLTFICMSMGFFFIRFFGQGVLTLVSRNMTMKWFDKRRGLANGILGAFTSLGFSIMPFVFEMLINEFTWQGAWIFLGILCAFIFPVVILLFFRDNPELCGLKPDGPIKIKKERKKVEGHIRVQFTLKRARKTYIFWVFSLGLAFNAFFITGLTFHIVSIFEQAGMTRPEALTIFIPASIIAVTVTTLGSIISDYIKLRYLLSVMMVGGLIASFGFAFLAPGFMKYVLVIGMGIMNGMFGIIAAVSWPRFFGREHLGAISGLNMSLIVFGSAIGPWLFSQSLDLFNTYKYIGFVSLGVVFILFINSFFVRNPQNKFGEVEMEKKTGEI